MIRSLRRPSVHVMWFTFKEYCVTSLNRRPKASSIFIAVPVTLYIKILQFYCARYNDDL